MVVIPIKEYRKANRKFTVEGHKKAFFLEGWSDTKAESQKRADYIKNNHKNYYYRVVKLKARGKMVYAMFLRKKG